MPYLGATSDLLGIHEPLIWRKTAPIPNIGEIDTEGSIAQSWEIAPDQSKITFQIRDDVPFNCGNCTGQTDWGNVTAEDIAWSFNNAGEAGNTNSRVGFVGAYLGPWSATDSSTLVAEVKPPLSGRWSVEISNQWRQSVAVSSKKAYDTLGEDKADVTFIGTGPFVATEWAEGAQIVAEALPEHYRSTSKVQTLIIRQIPEDASLIAAFKTGEIQIAQFDAEFVNDTSAAVPGSRIVKLGLGNTAFVSFGGNYWAEKDFDGNQIFPRDGFQPGSEHPWIGDPHDPAQMEKALKVRQALAMSIDRDAISQSLKKGLYPPAYTYVGFRPDSPQWKEDWLIPYDVDRAKELLEEAGADGFTTTIWGPTDREYGSAAEVLAAMWGQLGLNIQVEVTTYAAKRDLFITRNIPELFLHNIVAGDFDDPRGRLISPQAGGANRGVELPNDILDQYYLTSLSDFNADRTANNVAIQDYLTANRLFAPLYIESSLYLVSPDVLSWEPFTETFGNFNAPWTIEMK